MLKIGEFSKLSRVSVRMLRHYDEIGLLKPAKIDRFTDYRYYREDQLPIAGRIAALKDMGFSLPEVTVASCTYQGSYTQITDVYAAVIAWMEANGYEPAEPMFNIYHISPHETQNPDEFVTEICYPVKKK